MSHALSHTGFSPVDPAGGAGAAQHRSLTPLKPVDRAAPLLWQAWANGATVDNAALELYRPSRNEVEENDLTIQLAGGQISAVALSSPDNLDPDLMSRPAMELVTLTDRSIIWSHRAGTSAGESWSGAN